MLPLVPGSISDRVQGLDWPSIEASLDDYGYVTTPALLSATECASLAALYDREGSFRSRVDMARYNF